MKLIIKLKKLKSPCCKAQVRAEVYQTVSVEATPDGSLWAGFDFSDPELDKKTLFCSECGQALDWAYVGGGRTLPRYKLIKVRR